MQAINYFPWQEEFYGGMMSSFIHYCAVGGERGVRISTNSALSSVGCRWTERYFLLQRFWSEINPIQIKKIFFFISTKESIQVIRYNPDIISFTEKIFMCSCKSLLPLHENVEIIYFFVITSTGLMAEPRDIYLVEHKKIVVMFD